MLILNGDTVDKAWHTKKGTHSPLLETILKESTKRKIVWIRGNHDNKYVPSIENKILFCPSYDIGNFIHIEHGHNFILKGFIYRIFIICFRNFHNLLIAMGAEAVHVAFYAKNFPRLYETLCRHVRNYATTYAKERGFSVASRMRLRIKVIPSSL